MSYRKGRAQILELLDMRFGVDPEEFLPGYRAALDMLAEDDLATLAREAEPDHAAHFVADWLEGGFWPDVPVGEMLHAGVVEALRTARDAELPLGAIWLTGASDALDTVVVVGTHQVTLLVLTPPHPDELGVSD